MSGLDVSQVETIVLSIEILEFRALVDKLDFG
jgi:hypothetical protein